MAHEILQVLLLAELYAAINTQLFGYAWISFHGCKLVPKQLLVDPWIHPLVHLDLCQAPNEASDPAVPVPDKRGEVRPAHVTDHGMNLRVNQSFLGSTSHF